MAQVDRIQLLKRLLVTFRGELAEHTLGLEQAFLRLERLPTAQRSETIKTLLRTAHSLKGAARSVDLEPIEKACHLVEELLARLNSGQLSLSAELMTVFFSLCDSLKDATTALGQVTANQSDSAYAPPLLPTSLNDVADHLEAWSKIAPPVATTEVSDLRPAAASEPLAVLKMSPDDRCTQSVQGEKLDRLLAHSTELLSALWRVENHITLLASDSAHQPGGEANAAPANRPEPERRRLLDHWRQLEQTANALHADVQALRLVPFASACLGLPRLVRDLAQQSQKSISLAIRGGDLEVDKSVLEALSSLLRHLVRNAVDHGIETCDQRQRAGKTVEGRLTINAGLTRQWLEISVEDDGRGIDLAALQRVHSQRFGSIPANDRELLVSIFQPGLSTSGTVTTVSGRGMGLDIVRSQLAALQGTVEVAHTPGLGARFTLHVPLTLSTMRAIALEAGGQTYMIPCATIDRLVKISPDHIKTLERRSYVDIGHETYSLARLSDVLGMAKAGQRLKAEDRRSYHGVILRAGHSCGVVVVDELVAERSIVVKSLGTRLKRLPCVAGATILANGHLALVLNGIELLATMATTMRSFDQALPRPGAKKNKKRILIAEDSVTVRALEQSLLEGFGFEVHAAADGEAAWRLLQHKGADLLLTDIEMPGMDGFTLIKTIRASKKYTHLPVILLTSQDSDKDKRLGIEAGADAYLVKRSFDQTSLLATINQLI